MKYTLKNDLIEGFNKSKPFSFPKYTSQLINWANQNAQGTRPVVVGQMSELFPEFVASGEKITVENWRRWYTEKYPDAIEKATEKIYAQVQNLRNAFPLIDREMVSKWVEDLVIYKTYNGLYIQEAFLRLWPKEKGSHIGLLLPKKNQLELTDMLVILLTL